jgi:hypothetical protein
MNVSRFVLYGKDGTRYQAHSAQSRHDVSTLSTRGSIAGLTTVRLADGTPLNYVDADTFQNVITNELLSRTPPESEPHA